MRLSRSLRSIQASVVESSRDSPYKSQSALAVCGNRFSFFPRLASSPNSVLIEHVTCPIIIWARDMEHTQTRESFYIFSSCSFACSFHFAIVTRRVAWIIHSEVILSASRYINQDDSPDPETRSRFLRNRRRQRTIQGDQVGRLQGKVLGELN